MSEVPQISIDEIETLDFERNDDDNSRRPSINECHTDVEELDIDQDGKIKKNSLIDVLKINEKCNGGVTDIEDCEDSGDEIEDNSNHYDDGGFSINEFLDQGLVDEHSNLQENTRKNKLQTMQSLAKTPSPTVFNLTVNQPNLGGTTDVEQLEDSGDDNDSEISYSDDDKPIVLEGVNTVDVHDSMNMQKKSEKYFPKVIVPSTSSDSEEENFKIKPKPHHKPKKSHRHENNKSDVENIYFSNEENQKRPMEKFSVPETPDIEVMAFEGSDEENDKQDKLPEVNITFFNDKKEIKKKKVPISGGMLGLPENHQEAVTDVENLDSSEDDEDKNGVSSKPSTSKNLIPMAVVRSDALTDVEDFDDSENDFNLVEPRAVFRDVDKTNAMT